MAFSNASGFTTTNNLVIVTQTLSLSAASGSVTVGNPMTITANFSGPGGVAVPHANVRLSVARSQNDTLSSVSATTDASGNVTVTVSSSLAGLSQVNASAGPFSASTSFSFLPGPATAWSLSSPFQTFVIGNSGTAMQVAAKEAMNNLTVTSRSVVISSTDAQLLLSTDDVTFVPALTGITLTPSSGPVTFYASNNGGVLSAPSPR